jgi:GNAT superfamily N-acetyltransferase
VTSAANDAIARECFRSFRALPGAQLVDGDGVFGVKTAIPLTFFNGIAESQLDRDAVPRVIESFDETPFRWWISPSARPVDLADVLVANGMRHAFDSAGMVADLTTFRDADAPHDLTIERVTSLDVWIEVFLEGFRKPRSERAEWLRAYAHCDDSWIHFLGTIDGEPVATTSILAAGELAGVYHVVTLPPFRGRGIGAAMTQAAMRTARDLGARTAVLQSSAMGEGVYRSVGFETACELRLFVRL